MTDRHSREVLGPPQQCDQLSANHHLPTFVDLELPAHQGLQPDQIERAQLVFTRLGLRLAVGGDHGLTIERTQADVVRGTNAASLGPRRSERPTDDLRCPGQLE